MNFLYFKEGGCLLVSLAVALRVWEGDQVPQFSNVFLFEWQSDPFRECMFRSTLSNLTISNLDRGGGAKSLNEPYVWLRQTHSDLGKTAHNPCVFSTPL